MAETADWCSRRSRRAPSGQRWPRRSPGAIWAAITRQGIVSPRRSSPSRGVAPTTTPNQRPRISQPSLRTSTRAHRGTTATDPPDARCRRRQPGGAVLPRAAARQSVSQPGSGRSPQQHGHARRSMTTVAGARGRVPCDGNRIGTSLAGDGQRAPKMSHITLTVPGMNNPPSRYDVTVRVAVRVAGDDGHPSDPAAFAVAASRAASSMNASVISARTAEEVICVVGVAAPERRLAVAVALAVVADALNAEDPVRSPSR